MSLRSSSIGYIWTTLHEVEIIRSNFRPPSFVWTCQYIYIYIFNSLTHSIYRLYSFSCAVHDRNFLASYCWNLVSIFFPWSLSVLNWLYFWQENSYGSSKSIALINTLCWSSESLAPSSPMCRWVLPCEWACGPC